MALPIELDRVIHSFLHWSLCGRVTCPDFGVRGLQFRISTSSHSWFYQDELFNVQMPLENRADNSVHFIGDEGLNEIMYVKSIASSLETG